jgi:NAD(P)-dependent dehydrogenase (short-subunit alcohol dehydrogenase family)
MPDERELGGRRVIVTGAAQGIGQRIAEVLAHAGATVALADIRPTKARAVADALAARGHRAIAVECDIADPDSVERLARTVRDELGGIDGLINNAGIDAPPGTAWDITPRDWERVIDVNLNGAWWCTRAVLPTMREQRYGRIVFISSLAARMGNTDISPAYGTAKAGLIGLTVALSAQVEADGILVNAITPGPTGDTGRQMSAAERADYLSSHPLGFGGAQPVADGVRFLLGPSGDWLSGTVLNISGGEFRGI